MSDATNAEIRAWAQANGHPVADRGRIPAAAIAAYQAAHQPPVAPPAGATRRPPRKPIVRREGAARARAPERDTPPAAADAATDQPEVPPAADPATDGPESPPRVPRSWDPPPPPTTGPPPSAPPGGPPSTPPAWGPPPPPPPGGASSGPPAWGAPGPGAQGTPPPPPASGRDGFSVASLVLGIIPIFAGILAIVFGIIALARIRRSGRKGRGLAIAGIVLGCAWLLLIVTAVAIGLAGSADRSGDGSVIERGSVPATDLRVGDCPSSLPDALARTVTVVPCTEQHVAEVFASFDVDAGGYPGEDQLVRFANGGCAERLARYVGPGRDDDFDIFFLYPTDQSWRLGDHEINCLLTAPDGQVLPPRSAKAG